MQIPKESFFLLLLITVSHSQLPAGFAFISDIVEDVVEVPRYFGSENFIGQRIEGYFQSKLISTMEAALALKNVQEDLK